MLEISSRDGWATPPRFGTATLGQGGAPDEEADLLGDVTVVGCALVDTGWVLPAWSARRLGPVAGLSTDVGEDPKIG